MLRGVHASVVRKPKARLFQWLHLLSRFMRPPHTAKRGFSFCPSALVTVTESDLIARIARRVGPAPSWMPVGIGDDAAVIEPVRGAVEVVTTDSLIEDVHFRRGWTAPHAIGHKAVAVNLSDLAAMGATPRVVLLSLACPPICRSRISTT